MKQLDKLVDWLEANGSITGIECISELGVLNYKGRIHDLRKLGYNIETKKEQGYNRDGEKVTFARYYLRPREEVRA